MRPQAQPAPPAPLTQVATPPAAGGVRASDQDDGRPGIGAPATHPWWTASPSSGGCTSAAVEEAVDIALRLGDPSRAGSAAILFGGVTLWNLRAYGVVNTAMVELLSDLVTTTGVNEPELRAQLFGTLAVELYYSNGRGRREASVAEALELARGVGDNRLLGQVLNNAYLAQWTPDREAKRRSITEEALGLVGQGLPRQTELIARIHRMWSLLRQGELQAYDAEMEACCRLAAEVRIIEVSAQADAERLAAEAFRRLSATSVWGAQWSHSGRSHGCSSFRGCCRTQG